MSTIKNLSVLREAGVIRRMPLSTLAQIVKIVKAWGTGPAGGFSQLAVSNPDRVGVIDELGQLTFAELHQRSNALAHGFAALGIKERDQVAIMCRNHRGFIEATIAAAKLGADLLYLNTAFAGPQLVEVIAREKPVLVVADEEFAGLLAGADVKHRLVAWQDTPQGDDTVEALIAANPTTDHTPVEHHSKIVILTSGTTGTPKGAPRKEAGIANAVALLSRLPMKHGWRTHIAAPLFHTWGFAHLFMAMLLGSTMVLRRRFDPEEALRVVRDEKCDSFVVIPVMLQRILTLPPEVREKYKPLPHLKMTAASGSAMQGEMAVEWMDEFGDNLYNIYGSTEVAYASIAMPEDLRAAPFSAGKPPHATVVKIFDADGNEVPQGSTGRIFVGNAMLFEGYTGGGSKEMIQGLMSTGDVGRFDEHGRLYVEGRDDEMIVSGGENVFPREVEDCLVLHDAVVEAAAVGVEDKEFGYRLRAFVVVSDPAAANEEALKDWVRANLARYKVPREIIFLDELPRNATGKILKRVLAQRP
ncbi:AMP-binding protein [Nocardioides daphniae]|uniref:Acyl-CoA synthetase n=1 Tax=Nocardioides daphniae TaxID=402297 RepID=A0A4V1CWK8_9ACTN|nr:AMP-binding protein [Nocardioides daphniae]QCC77617.1 acyl-CoA synthetase [Nocardioides daphniae]GGD30143.1 fatty-acyl-CoA synthase [Nocardioides daphniae]